MQNRKARFSEAKRLTLKDGSWLLELECLVPFGEAVLRPTREQVKGRNQILRYLKQSPGGIHIYDQTEDVMNQWSGDVGDSRAFEMDMGHWVALSDQKSTEEANAPQRPSESGGGGLSLMVRALRRELDACRNRISELEAQNLSVRMAQLEAAVTELRRRFDEASQGGLPMAPADAGELEGLVAAAESDARTENEAKSADAVEGGALAAAPPGGPAPGPKEPMNPPDVERVSEVLTELLGPEFACRKIPNSQGFDLGKYPGPFVASALVDDDGCEIALIIADLNATIAQGSTLMMLGEDGIEAQLEESAASEDAIEGMSEVFNTLTAPINGLPKNPHVRATPAQTFDPSAVAWSARQRMDVRDGRGGHLIFVAR